MTEIDETLPFVVQEFLRKGARLESIRLHANGRWSHEGLDFENPKIIDLFSRSVGRTDGGTWVLKIGQFTYPIEVEDTGYFVERTQVGGDRVSLRLSDGTAELLDPSTLSYVPEGRLYCRVKGDGFRARFLRAAYYDLAEHIEESSNGWELRLATIVAPIAVHDSQP